MSTCLVVAFCNTFRDGQEKHYDDYFRVQRETLAKVKHNLDRIVFVIAEDGREDIEIIEDRGITIVKKPNRFFSFGSWGAVYNIFKDQYEYYIFSEDDYVFTLDNFDTLMKQKYIGGYLCVWKGNPSYDQWGFGEAIATIGMTKGKNMVNFEMSDEEIETFLAGKSLNPSNAIMLRKTSAMKQFFKNFKNVNSMNNYNMHYYDFNTDRSVEMNDRPEFLLVSYQHYIANS